MFSAIFETFKGGTITNERTTPKEMMFNKSSSFNLMFGGEQFTQDYSCSKVLTETPTEAKFQLFSQSQVLYTIQALYMNFSASKFHPNV